MTITIRLPGISVEAPPAERAMALPPMDIAAFAGFAARGPCHRAVAIDSVAAFEAVFGGDVDLARGRDGAPDLRAHLPSAVRGFFANGGQRCWVARLARTVESEAHWRALAGAAGSIDDVAEANTFPLPGVLHRLPGLDGGESQVRPAWLAAASVGSWSDAMALSARIASAPLGIAAAQARPGGLRFTDPGGIETGALIEFASADGSVRRYARAIGRVGGEWHAAWCGAFARLDDEPDQPAIAGHAQLTLRNRHFAANLTPGSTPQIAFADPPEQVAIGSWVRFFATGQAVWLLCERYADGVASGPAWRQVPNRLPQTHFAARRIRIEIRADNAGERHELPGIEPGMAGPSSLAAMIGDDAWYAPAHRRRAVPRSGLMLREADRAHLPAEDPDAAWQDAAARFLAASDTASDRDLLRAAWLPLGLDAAFVHAGQARPRPRLPLARDGLSLFDETLFLDPGLAELPADRLAAALVEQRDLAERQLFGLHALLDTPDARFGRPTILAVPDMIHPGWEALSSRGAPGRPDAHSPVPANWLAHAGGCPPAAEDNPSRVAPDFSHFLDAATRLLPAPVLSAPTAPDRDGAFTLRWHGGDLAVPVAIEESGAADFSGAVEIYRGGGDHLDLAGKTEGVWYYRLRADDGFNVSAWSARAVIVRRADYMALGHRLPRLRRLQLAAMRAAAASQDMFALLAMPRRLPMVAVAGHVTALTAISGAFASADRLGPQEERVLSFAAMHHGWLLYRADAGASEALWAAPPEGCIAGQMAAIARTEGAWIAPANRAIADAVGTEPRLPLADRQVLQDLRINALAASTHGFCAADAMTLSGETEWRQINVRRLMILLRLAAISRGEPLVFEPNGDVVRRALEREFGQMLGDFQRRGAFAGGRQGWRLAVQRSLGDHDGGRLVAEIGIAPSQPLRFLSFRLVQHGARLTLGESA